MSFLLPKRTDQEDGAYVQQAKSVPEWYSKKGKKKGKEKKKEKKITGKDKDCVQSISPLLSQNHFDTFSDCE